MAGTMMRSPVREFAPENKKAITDPVNSDEWFKRDVLPRHRNVSCLTCGVVRDVSARAEFKDMRKLRDNSRVTRAFLGVSYIGKLVRDDSGWQGTAEIPVSRSIAEKRYREEAEFPLVPQKREAELS
ncbi:STAS domain-containing protein, partial [Aduncisulcus paluster]